MKPREVSERHRHRYEVNNAYRDQIAASGLRFSGTSPDGHLVEFVEYPRDVHPFLVGTQAHPELKSRPTRPHPLFVGFIGAALDYKAAERLPVEIPSAPNGNEHAEESRGCCSSQWPWLTTCSRPSRPKPLYQGNILALRVDQVRMPGGGTATREVVEHYGAVAVAAVDDAAAGGDDLSVPASAGSPAVGTARRSSRCSRRRPAGHSET